MQTYCMHIMVTVEARNIEDGKCQIERQTSCLENHPSIVVRAVVPDSQFEKSRNERGVLSCHST